MYNDAYREHLDYELNRYNPYDDGGVELMLADLRYGDPKPLQEWFLTDWDVWVRNPNYRGPEGPHPNDMPDDWSQEALDEYHRLFALYEKEVEEELYRMEEDEAMFEIHQWESEHRYG